MSDVTAGSCDAPYIMRDVLRKSLSPDAVWSLFRQSSAVHSSTRAVEFAKQNRTPIAQP